MYSGHERDRRQYWLGVGDGERAHRYRVGKGNSIDVHFTIVISVVVSDLSAVHKPPSAFPISPISSYATTIFSCCPSAHTAGFISARWETKWDCCIRQDSGRIRDRGVVCACVCLCGKWTNGKLEHDGGLYIPKHSD